MSWRAAVLLLTIAACDRAPGLPAPMADELAARTPIDHVWVITSDTRSAYELVGVARQVHEVLDSIGPVTLCGERARELHVELDARAVRARGLDLVHLVRRLQTLSPASSQALGAVELAPSLRLRDVARISSDLAPATCQPAAPGLILTLRAPPASGREAIVRLANALPHDVFLREATTPPPSTTPPRTLWRTDPSRLANFSPTDVQLLGDLATTGVTANGLRITAPLDELTLTAPTGEVPLSSLGTVITE